MSFYFDDNYADKTQQRSVPFGKHEGYSISHMAEHEPGYLRWILSLEGTSGFAKWGATFHKEINDALDNTALHKMRRNFPEFTLSDSQAAAVTKINMDLLSNPDCHMFRLQGAAGYGKSYSTIEVVRLATEMGFRITACATSYVATQNLAEELEDLGVDCGTIASTFKLNREIVNKAEVYSVTPMSEFEMAARLSAKGLVIVDEYSMVEDKVAHALIDTAHACGGKLLVVGDVSQLPSPAQDTDSIFNQVQPSTELTEPMRYEAGSDLHRVETAVRKDPCAFDQDQFQNSRTIIPHHGYGDFLRAYVDSYKKHPSLNVKMLWYKRADVIQSNEDIRNMLFGEFADIVELDEQLMVMRTTDVPVYHRDTRAQTIDEYDNKETLRMYSGTTYRVNELIKDEVRFEVTPIDPNTKMPLDSILYTTPCYRAVLSNGLQADLLFTINESRANEKVLGGKEFNENLGHIAGLCNEQKLAWKKYHDYRAMFLQIAHSYATTVHRSQGASLDIVYTNIHALLQASPFVARKLAYVGLTRAKRELHLLN